MDSQRSPNVVQKTDIAQEGSGILRRPTPETTISDSLSERKTFPSRVVQHTISSSNVQAVDQGLNTAVSPTLRRARSQVDLGKNGQQHVAEEPIVASRRSSISCPRHSGETNRILEVTNPLCIGLDHGLIKLHNRTTRIELAQWQRALDLNYSAPSSALVKYHESVECHSVSPRSLSPNCDDTSSEHEDCEGESTGQAKTKVVPEKTADTVCHGTATQDPRWISETQASALTLAEYQANVERQHKEEIAFKDEQIHHVVSMYQILLSKHEDLETETRQQAVIRSRAEPVTQASSPELMRLRVALDKERKQSMDTLQYLTDVQVELENANNAKHALDVLLYSAYGQIDALNEQLSTANISGGYSRINDLENRLKDTEEEQDRQLFNAFQENQALETKVLDGDKAKQQLKESVKKLTNLNLQVTSELIDMKSDCERNLVQNMMMRDAMATDPKKGAEYDKTVEHLKGELVEADDRAIKAEEQQIQLQKDLELYTVKSQAENTALGEENRILNLAVGDLRSSKDSVQKALNALIKTLSAGSSIQSVIQTYHADLAQEKQHDTRLLNLLEMHSQAVQKAKVLELRCNSLDTTAVEQETKYNDLSHAHRAKCDALDILTMETDAKAQEHASALAAATTDLAAAKQQSATLATTLNNLQYSTADACTAWFLHRQETDLASTKTGLEEAEKRIVQLTQDLRTKTEFETMDKNLRDLAAYDAAHFPELAPAHRDEIEELKAKIEGYEQKLCTPDVLPWAEHLRRVEEVRVEVDQQARETMQEEVNREVVIRFGKEYVLPLVELGEYFCEYLARRLGPEESNADENRIGVRIQRLEHALLSAGCPLQQLEDAERRMLVVASRRFGVLG